MSLHDEMERLVDQYGLHMVLSMLGMICDYKALDNSASRFDDPPRFNPNEFVKMATGAIDIKDLVKRLPSRCKKPD